MTVIRDYNPALDYAGLRACVVELQDFEHRIDSRFPDGESIVDEYIPDVLHRCRQYAGKILVAEKDGAVVGYVMIWTRVPGEDIEDGDFECGRLADLAVLQRFRGHGVGGALVRAAEDWALQNGVSYLRLGVMAANRRAHELYRRLGYADIGIEMEKTLTTTRPKKDKCSR